MAAAEATATAGAGITGGPPATTTSRFAAACGALSQYVRAAEAERARAAGAGAWASAAAAAAAPRPLLPLMPGADVGEEPDEAGPAPSPAPAAQLTIVYGGRALVLDHVPADRAADLLRLAAAAASGRGGIMEQLSSAADLPVARKASLHRFMEKRKGRAAAARAGPYRRPGDDERRGDDLTL
ncbi:unnamed protein product [Urochloa humidicola]